MDIGEAHVTLRYPKAKWRALPEEMRQPAIVPTQVILHTVVGHGSPYSGFDRPGNGKESHLWVSMDGAWEQYVSLSRSADANYRANLRPDGTAAISVETEDLGPATVAETAWTPVQVAELAKFLAWCNDPEGLPAAWMALHGTVLHPIPLVRCATPDSPGVGYHTMFGAPSAWTPVAKSCPGAARIAQFDTVLDLARQVRSANVPHPPPAEEEPMATHLWKDERHPNIFVEPSGAAVGPAELGGPYHGLPLVEEYHDQRLSSACWRAWGVSVEQAAVRGLLLNQ